MSLAETVGYANKYSNPSMILSLNFPHTFASIRANHLLVSRDSTDIPGGPLTTNYLLSVYLILICL